ncbi:MAG TPA: hypothetical protein VFI31_06800 [Pirellulales bacterium]|nr:hypothetical protein [Pirellulales bacterium]
MPVLIVVGAVAAVLVVALVAALFSGRVWAVIAGVLGTLLLIVGGLLMVGVLLFRARSAQAVATIETEPAVLTVDVSGGPRSDARPLTQRSITEDPLHSDDQESRADDNSSELKVPTDAASGPPRPAWMDGPLGRVGNVYRTTVKVGPLFSRTECEQQLAPALDQAVKTYADHLLGEGKGRYVNLERSFIRNHLVHGEWEERRQTTFDTMIILHELLEFDRDANDAIEGSYKQSVVVGRLGYTAAGGGVVLGLLTILFGYLKLDTLTRGYYTGRLSLTALAAILALAAIAGLLVLA